MNVIPSGTAPGGNIASTGIAIWIAGSASAKFAVGVSMGAITCRRWTFLAGLGAVSVSTTTAAAASATCSPGGAPSASVREVSFFPPHRSTSRMRGSLDHRHRRARGIPNSLEHAAPHPRLRCPEARDPSKQPNFLKSHTLNFSASFLIARSTVSPTVEVGISRTSPISR